MSRQLFILFSAVLLLISRPAHSQGQDQSLPADRDTTTGYCHFDKMMEALDQNPAHRQMRRDIDQMVRDFIRDNPMDERGGNEIVIPVVFHVVHDGEDVDVGTNLAYERIVWQVNALNAAFSRNYPNYNTQQHHSSAVNTHIRFCLATLPAGTTWTDAAEPGVMRYSTSLSDVLDPQVPDITNNDFTGVMPLVNLTHPTAAYFPFNRYLNIWCVRSLGDAKAVGIPPQAAGNYYPLDGVITCSDIVGDNSVTGNSFDMDDYLQEGKILAHETGHYLDLLHTFQPNYQTDPPLLCEGLGAAGALVDACDVAGDHICDIPPCQLLSWGYQFQCNFSSNTCTGTGDYPGHNYMTYMDDGCLNAFTQGQANWMNAVLNNNLQNRYPLWQPANLNSTGVACYDCYLTANIAFKPAHPCPGTPIDFSTPAGSAFCATQWNWQFPGSVQGQSSQQNPQNIVYPVSGVYTVTLSAGDGITTVQETIEVTVTDRVATITGPAAQLTVCSGSIQAVEFLFEGGRAPYTYTLSNGTVFQTQFARCNHVLSVNDTITISIVSAHDSLTCDAAVSGSVTFNTVNCCTELLSNGSFTDGNTGFQSDIPYNSVECGVPQYFYTIGPYATAPYCAWYAFDLQDFGIGMAFNCPTQPAHTTPYNYTDLWTEQVYLYEDVDYYFNYLVSNANGSIYEYLDRYVHLRVAVTDGSGNIVFSSDFDPDTSLYGRVSAGRQYWCQHRALINTAAIAEGNYTISIRQIGDYTNFGHAWWDFVIDEISLRPAPHVPLVADAGADTAYCHCTTGSGALLVTGTAANGYPSYSYEWYNDVGAYMGNSALLAADCFAHPSHPIPGYSNTYTLIVTDSWGCIATDQVIAISADVIPDIVLTASPAAGVCAGETVTYTASPGFSNYVFMVGGIMAQNGSSAIFSYSGTASGASISVSVTSSDGCVLISEPVIYTVIDLNPVINPSGSISLCEGNTVVLDAGTGYATYLWSPGGETTQLITVDTAGSYSVAVTGSGCSGSSAAVVVTTAPVVSPQIEVNVNQLCVADTFCTYQWMINHTPIPGATSFCYIVSQSAQYSVEIGSCDGCEIKPPVVEAFVGTDERDFADHISLYPNPTAGTLILELSFDQPEDLVVRLRDIAGRELREAERLQGVRLLRKEISLAEFADGFYFLVMEKQDSRLVKRVMKSGR